MDFLKRRGRSTLEREWRRNCVLLWETDAGFGLRTAYNPHIFLTEPLAFKAYTATNIFKSGYMNIYIYIYNRCTFYKNVCMPSGAGFVESVTMAASSALLSVEFQGFVKRVREHVFNCVIYYNFFNKKQGWDQLHALMQITNILPSFWLLLVVSSFEGVREADRFAHEEWFVYVMWVQPLKSVYHPSPLCVSKISWTLPCSGRDWNACLTPQKPSFPFTSPYLHHKTWWSGFSSVSSYSLKLHFRCALFYLCTL